MDVKQNLAIFACVVSALMYIYINQTDSKLLCYNDAKLNLENKANKANQQEEP